eukprot:763462-Hanusia_phi.AAC.4
MAIEGGGLVGGVCVESEEGGEMEAGGSSTKSRERVQEGKEHGGGGREGEEGAGLVEDSEVTFSSSQLDLPYSYPSYPAPPHPRISGKEDPFGVLPRSVGSSSMPKKQFDGFAVGGHDQGVKAEGEVREIQGGNEGRYVCHGGEGSEM